MYINRNSSILHMARRGGLEEGSEVFSICELFWRFWLGLGFTLLLGAIALFLIYFLVAVPIFTLLVGIISGVWYFGSEWILWSAVGIVATGFGMIWGIGTLWSNHKPEAPALMKAAYRAHKDKFCTFVQVVE